MSWDRVMAKFEECLALVRQQNVKMAGLQGENERLRQLVEQQNRLLAQQNAALARVGGEAVREACVKLKDSLLAKCLRMAKIGGPEEEQGTDPDWFVGYDRAVEDYAVMIATLPLPGEITTSWDNPPRDVKADLEKVRQQAMAEVGWAVPQEEVCLEVFGSNGFVARSEPMKVEPGREYQITVGSQDLPIPDVEVEPN